MRAIPNLPWTALPPTLGVSGKPGQLHRLLQDRLSGGRLCKLHQALALPPDQMRAVEVGDPAWSYVRLRLIERGLGAIQCTEAGLSATCDGMGFRLRATQPGPEGRRAGGRRKVAGLAQHGQGCPVVATEQRDVGR